MKRKKYNHRWEKTAYRRRFLLGLLIFTTTFVASGYMAFSLPQRGSSVLEVVLVIFFALLFAWISIGFWTSLIGFLMLVKNRPHWLPTHSFAKQNDARLDLPPTAVLMPIYNETPQQVFEGLSAIYQSISRTGALKAFEFFVLSDSNDPDIWVQEEVAWQNTCRKLEAWGRLFYRHRSPNIKRKSGNIADFCRRWGRNYRYMVVLDADSIMTGDTIVNMVRAMEKEPSIGILQTAPKLAGKGSLLARLQQFAAYMYGPMFAAGLHFWQLGDAQYWGHNAIIRIEPFMRHCALPRLPGTPPLGGDILSHDFVEAALMRRAGWGVWLAYDLDGSYEEPPSTLIDELVRDRRWCQGNLQHLRLLFTRGLFPAHRYLFLNGAMAYISALLWLIFLSLSTAEAVVMVLSEPEYFPQEGSLFPDWQVWNPEWMIILLISTTIILFMPKLLSLVLAVLIKRRASDFGGTLKASLSVMAEVILSILLAPLRMLAHSKFVIVTLLGGKIGWTPPVRAEQGTSWKAALRFHGKGMLLALAWGGGVFLINRAFFWWIVPILFPLVMAVPLSVLTSKRSIGQAFRRMGLFLTLPEVDPPPELQRETETSISPAASVFNDQGFDSKGFIRAVVEPSVHCLHIAIRRGERRVSPVVFDRLDRLAQRAVQEGPDRLSSREKIQILTHAAILRELHRRVWDLPEGPSAQKWGF